MSVAPPAPVMDLREVVTHDAEAIARAKLEILSVLIKTNVTMNWRLRLSDDDLDQAAGHLCETRVSQDGVRSDAKLRKTLLDHLDTQDDDKEIRDRKVEAVVSQLFVSAPSLSEISASFLTAAQVPAEEDAGGSDPAVIPFSLDETNSALSSD